MIRRMYFMYVYLSFLKINKRGLAFIIGLMAGNMKDSGKMESKMGKENMFY